MILQRAFHHHNIWWFLFYDVFPCAEGEKNKTCLHVPRRQSLLGLAGRRSPCIVLDAYGSALQIPTRVNKFTRVLGQNNPASL